MKGWERGIYTVSVQRPEPQNTNAQKERSEGKTVEDKKRMSSLGQ